MELNFGENIKQLRKKRDLTQEALADALGISAQSVSKWECAYGYPDITQLPAIANFFGITIDELMGNDAAGKEKALQDFRNQVTKYEQGSEEQIRFILDYCRQYPDQLVYTNYLCCKVSDHMIDHPENRSKYNELLHDTANKLLDTVEYRQTAIHCMVRVCEEHELEEWLNLLPYHQNSNRRSMMLMRSIAWHDTDKHKLYLALHHLETMAGLTDWRYPDAAGPEDKAKYQKSILDTIASFGSDGQIPDGWLAVYAYIQLVNAACLFGMHRHEEGKHEFLSAMEKLHRFHTLQAEYLDTGSVLFGGLTVDKKWITVQTPTGEIYQIVGYGQMRLYASARYIWKLLTNPCWAWFDSVREEEYYKEAVQWLAELEA